MNHFSKINSLLQEAFSFKQYKRMNPAIIVFLAILMAPLYLAALAVSVVYYLYAIGYKFLSMPADILRAFYKDEGSTVQHATQAVVYLICLPFVFSLQVLLSFCSLTIGVLYFTITILLQIASLNGIDFKPFILDEATRNTAPLEKMPTINGLFLLVSSYLLILIFIIFKNIEVLAIIRTIALILYIVLIILYPIFVFKKDGSSQPFNKILALVITIVLGATLLGGLTYIAIDKGLFAPSKPIEISIYKNRYSSAENYVTIEKDDYYTIEFDQPVTGSVNNSSIINSYLWSGYLYEGTVEIIIDSVHGNRQYQGYIYATIER